MAKMSAPAPDERRRTRGAVDPAANVLRGSGKPAPALDSEMLDLVQRFERGYAELAPAIEEPTPHAASDELFPEFPDIFDEPPAAKPAAGSARVFPMPRRDPESGTPAWPRETPAADRGGDVDLDEAMAILRASEQRTTAARADVHEEPRSTPRAWRSEDVAVRHSEPQAPARQDRASSAATWTARSHGKRSFALAAAVVALVVGVVAGYLLGHDPSSKSPTSVIESSGQGGTQLKLERNLPQR